MAKARDGIVDGQARRLWAGGSVAGLAEGQVLRRFVADRDPTAFEALVERHGPMTLDVCRRHPDSRGHRRTCGRGPAGGLG